MLQWVVAKLAPPSWSVPGVALMQQRITGMNTELKALSFNEGLEKGVGPEIQTKEFRTRMWPAPKI